MNSAEAEKLMKQAEGRLNTNAIIEWFSTSNKFEEAADLFGRAANLFKMDKEFERAGNCFMRIAEISLKNDAKHDAASAYINAANSFRQVDLKSKKNKKLKFPRIH
jgi:alpha-soluble NSF attachment protein